MRSLSGGPRLSPLVVLGATGALVLCWFHGLVVRQYDLSIRNHPHHGDYLLAAACGAIVATMLALGVVALGVLRAPRWLVVLGAAAAAHHGVLAATDLHRAGSARPDGWIGTSPLSDAVIDALSPGSWPLLALLLATVVALLRRPGGGRIQRPLGRRAQTWIGATFVVASLTGLAGWYLAVYFTFAVEPDPQPADYQNAIVTAAGTALLLVVGALVVWRRWCIWSHAVPAALGLLVQGYVVLACLEGALATPDPGYLEEVEIRFSLEYAAWIPTSWPLLGVLVWAVASAASSSRRPAPVPSVANGRVDPWRSRSRSPGVDTS